MEGKIFSTKTNSLDAFVLLDLEVEKAIKEKYTFEAAYHPEGYDVVFLLIKDDIDDSRQDKWKAVFFKKKRKLKATVTLDNIDELKSPSVVEVSFFKEIDGNYEEMINIAVDLIKKYVAKVEQNGA